MIYHDISGYIRIYQDIGRENLNMFGPRSTLYMRRELGMPEELQEQYEQLSSEEQDQLKGAVHGFPWAEGKLEHSMMNSWITHGTRNSLLLFHFQSKIIFCMEIGSL